MTLTLWQAVQSIFVDMTIDGERVDTVKEFKYDDNWRRYLASKQRVLRETGEVLETAYYHPSSRRPYAVHVNRTYMLA